MVNYSPDLSGIFLLAMESPAITLYQSLTSRALGKNRQ
jgi:hypothetical protein